MTRIHKGVSGARFSQAVAAVLFVAVCAYLGAGLWRDLRPRTRFAAVRRGGITESLELEGIVFREEQALGLPEGAAAPEDGQRVNAGASLDSAGTVTAPASAVFCRDTDGLETLSPAALKTLTAEKLRALLKTEPAAAGGGRLVLGRAWYFAALAPAEPEAKAGEEYRLSFEGLEDRFPARLLRREEGEDGGQLLIFRLTAGDRACLSLRRTGARLLLREYSGLELPEEAVATEGGEEYVWILGTGETRRQPVEILARSEGRCLAAAAGALREGCTVVIPGETSG